MAHGLATQNSLFSFLGRGRRSAPARLAGILPLCRALLLSAIILLPLIFLQTAHAQGRGANPEPAPAQKLVVVRRGQTLFSIARAHNVPMEALIAANGIDDPNLIWPGQRLIIPTGPFSRTGPAHAPWALPRPAVSPANRVARSVVVKRGDTVSSIARANGVPVDALIAANRLRNPHSIWPGQALVIPVAGSVPRTGAYAAVPRVNIAGGFLWPARGYITSHFGWRRRNHHNGIDIAATWGSPIIAPMAGRVTFAGWYKGYGKMIVIGHGNGLSTRYAHASSLAVKMGDTVKPGQVIGRVGCTGACWGTHLHFEVRLQGRPIDPLPYLD